MLNISGRGSLLSPSAKKARLQYKRAQRRTRKEDARPHHNLRPVHESSKPPTRPYKLKSNF